MKRFLLVILAGCFGGCSLLVDEPKSFTYVDSSETDTNDPDGSDESDWSTVTEETASETETQATAETAATESETAATETVDPTDSGTGTGSSPGSDTGPIDTGSATTGDTDTVTATMTEPTSDTSPPSDTGGTASDTECVPVPENPTNGEDDDCDSLIDEPLDSDTSTPIGDPCPWPNVCMQAYQCGWVFEHPVIYGDFSCPNPQDFCCGEKP